MAITKAAEAYADAPAPAVLIVLPYKGYVVKIGAASRGGQIGAHARPASIGAASRSGQIGAQARPVSIGAATHGTTIGDSDA